MSKYIVKANSVEGNPEFAPDPEIIGGLEAEGFVMILINDGRPARIAIQNVTAMELARIIAASEDNEAGSVIAQAIAIAEGLKKAERIRKENEKARTLRGLAEMLRGK